MITRSKSSQIQESPKPPKKDLTDLKNKNQSLEIENLDLIRRVSDYQKELEQSFQTIQKLKLLKNDAETLSQNNLQKLKSEEKAKETLLAQKSSLQSALDQIKAEFAEETATLEKTKVSQKDLERTKAEFEQKIKNLNGKSRRLEAEIADKSGQVSQVREELQNTSQKLERTQNSLLNLQSDMTKLEGVASERQSQIESLELGKIQNEASLKTKVAGLEIELSSAKEEKGLLEQQRKDLKTQFETLSSDSTQKISQKERDLEQYKVNLEMREKQCQLLKESTKNLEEHISALNSEIHQREEKIQRLTESWEKHASANETLKNKIEGFQTQKDADLQITKSIGEITSFLHPDYKNASLERFEASPDMSAEELYLKFAKVYDAYKAAFREKLALEDGLKRFSRYVEAKTPQMRHQKAKFEMLKKSYSSLSTRLTKNKRKHFAHEVEMKGLHSELQAVLAKKKAYKQSTRILKEQVLHLISERNKSGNKDFVFEDFRGLQEKYVKLLKKSNESNALSKNERAKLKREKSKIMAEFAASRENWKASSKSYERDIKELATKISALKNMSSKSRIGGDIAAISRPTSSGDSNEAQYNKLICELKNGTQFVQKDQIEALSKAEAKSNEAEKEASQHKMELIRTANALTHEQKMRQLAEKEAERLEANLKRETANKVEKSRNIAALEEKLCEAKSALKKTKAQKQTADCQIEFLKGSVNALQTTEKRALEKLSESVDSAGLLKGKIARLEETNRLMASAERGKIETLLKEKKELEFEWQDLRQARELDLKSGREALEESNGLTRSAFAELKEQKELNSTQNKVIKELQGARSALRKKVENGEKQLEELRKFKEGVEKADLEVISGDLEKIGSDEKLSLEISVKKIVLYEREIEDLRLEKSNLEGMFKASDALCKETAKKLGDSERKAKADLGQLMNQNEDLSVRVLKASRALQQNLIESVNLKKDVQKFEGDLRLSQTAFAEEKRQNELKRVEMEEKIQQISSQFLAEKTKNNSIRTEYEGEVKRHGDTIEKLKRIQSELNEKTEASNTSQTVNEEMAKQLKITTEAIASEKKRHQSEIAEINDQLAEQKDKNRLVAIELDRTNALNRYLRQNKGVRTEETLGGDSDERENYQRMLADLRKEKDIVNAQYEKATENLKKETDQRELHQILISELQKDLKNSIQKVAQMGRDKVNQSDLDEKKLQITVLTENNKSLRNKMEGVFDSKTALSEALSKLKKSIEPTERELHALKKEKSELSIRLESKEKLALEWEKRCLDIFEKNTFIDPDEYKKIRQQLRQKEEQLKTKEESFAETCKRQKAELEHLTKEGKRLSEELSAANDSLKKMGDRNVESLTKERDALREKHSELIRERFAAQKERVQSAEKEKESFNAVSGMKETTDQMIKEIEKYKLLLKKVDFMLKEEKETSTIYKRNAQTANARFSETKGKLLKALKENETLQNLVSARNAPETNDIASEHESGEIHTNVPETDQISPRKTVELPLDTDSFSAGKTPFLAALTEQKHPEKSSDAADNATVPITPKIDIFASFMAPKRRKSPEKDIAPKTDLKDFPKKIVKRLKRKTENEEKVVLPSEAQIATENEAKLKEDGVPKEAEILSKSGENVAEEIEILSSEETENSAEEFFQEDKDGPQEKSGQSGGIDFQNAEFLREIDNAPAEWQLPKTAEPPHGVPGVPPPQKDVEIFEISDVSQEEPTPPALPETQPPTQTKK